MRIGGLQSVGNADLSFSNEVQGDILVRNATDWVRLAKGGALQVLRTNAGLTAPEWADAVGGASYKIGTFTRDSSLASGSQAVTGVGFTPSLLWFSVVQSGTSELAFGWATGVGTGGGDGLAINNQTGPTIWGFTGNTIGIIEPSGASYLGNINSFDGNGFTIAWVKAGATTGFLEISYIAFA